MRLQLQHPNSGGADQLAEVVQIDKSFKDLEDFRRDTPEFAESDATPWKLPLP
jgi:hypothetical protein